jgi:uncharacterized protein DUF4352
VYTQQQPYPQQPGYGGYPPPRPPQNGLGTAGFVLGLIGLLFSFIPVIGVIAWPLVLIGLVLAGIGLSRARRGRATNKGLAIAGLVCASLGLLMCVLYTAAFSSAVATAPTAPPLAAPTVPGIATAEQSTDSSATAPVAGVGEQVQDGSFAFTVTKLETRESLGSGFLTSEAEGSYVLVHVTVTNVGTEAATFSDSNQTLLDADRREYSADSGTAVMYLPGSEAFLNQINPGNSVDGVLVFDVPEGLAPAAIELRESLFSDGATVSLAG